MGGSNGMLEPGNVQVAAPYFIGAKSGVIAAGMAAGADYASLIHLGMLPGVPPATPGVVVPTPIRVSQIRVHFVGISSYANSNSFVIEVHKAAFTAQNNTNGATTTPISRKTSGYPAIVAAETNLYTVDTSASGVTGGTVTLQGSGANPILIAAGGAGSFGLAAPIPGFTGIWKPSDLCPLTLEAGEGLVFRNGLTLATGTGRFYVGIDFVR